MEKDFGSWFNHQCLDLQSPLLSSSGAQPNIGKGNSFSVYMNSHFNEVLTNGDFPLFAFSALPQPKAGQPNEPHNWFNCSPCFPQGVSPLLNPVPIKNHPAGSVENVAGIENCNTGTGCSLKKFLVFDKSDDQTTLVYSSANCPPAQCPESWSPKPHAYNLIKEHPGINRNEASPLGNLIDDEYIEESHQDAESEWHEDTDELNALIYCDNDYDYLEDDEVTSTGRSPSTMTVHDKHECLEERGEEVESSAGPTKRQKLLDGSHDVLSFMHTATTAKPYLCSEVEDDAESSCGNDSNEVSGVSGSKRSRKESIRKTISILQMIIPGVKGKDAMLVIDETIRCLRSLKAEAKSLGL